MGRLKSWGSNLNPLFSGKYKKLLEEYGSKDYSRLLLQESLQDYLSYACGECGHVQKLQAEELNNIVGHAFRLAYAAHLQKSAGATINHKSDHVIPTSQHLAPPHTPSYPVSVSPTVAVSPNTSVHKHRGNRPQQHCQLVNVSNSLTSSLTGVGSTPSCCSSSIQTPVRVSPVKKDLSKPSQRHQNHHQISPDSTKSSTKLNNSKRLVNKASQLKKLPVNLENNLEMTLDDNIENTLQNSLDLFDDCQPLVTSSPSSSLSSSLSFGSSCHQVEEVTSSQVMSHATTTMSSTASTTSTAIIGYINDKDSDRTSVRLPSEAQGQDHNTKCNRLSDDDKIKCISQISVISNTSSNFVAPDLSTSNTLLGSPPPLPDRTDSLTPPEEPHLQSAAWFQAGIPREIALEVLSREPVGAFMVRESTSKPGCYALSLRVPRDFTVSGIAHYLVVNNTNGYKIKGFTKEFKTLSALITHHSVMPELLPCPLSLSRYNPTFTNEAQNTTTQNEEDPDYNTLSDFRKIMADLNV